MKHTRKIILASSSPRRKQLLEQLGISFRVIPSHIEEKLNPRLKPQSQAESLSLQKATTVAKHHTNALIIAADTFVVLENEIIGKPQSLQDAKRILTKLSGKMHLVITGFTVYDTISSKIITRSEVSHVFFKTLTQQEIDAFIHSEEILDKAGAYSIQGRAAMFIEKIEGDYTNIVGLPLFALGKILKKMNYTILLP